MQRLGTTTAIAAALALLAGCGGNKQQQGNEAALANAQQDYQTQLQAMPEASRNAVFIRAIRDAGFDCQQVDASAATGATSWAAHCSDGRQWTIAIGTDGLAHVTGNPEQVRAPLAAPGNSS
ncbi:MAG: hypothetical protein ACM3YM_07245 [Sphingomonadales bacterium]